MESLSRAKEIMAVQSSVSKISWKDMKKSGMSSERPWDLIYKTSNAQNEAKTLCSRSLAPEMAFIAYKLKIKQYAPPGKLNTCSTWPALFRNAVQKQRDARKEQRETVWGKWVENFKQFISTLILFINYKDQTDKICNKPQPLCKRRRICLFLYCHKVFLSIVHIHVHWKRLLIQNHSEFLV